MYETEPELDVFLQSNRDFRFRQVGAPLYSSREERTGHIRGNEGRGVQTLEPTAVSRRRVNSSEIGEPTP